MNNSIHIQEGTLPTSLPLLLLQVLNLTQISPEIHVRAEQLELTDSIELARKLIYEAIQSKQPISKRNEQLAQSNNRLLELISNEIQWYADARIRNVELHEFISKMRSNTTTNRESTLAIPDVKNGTDFEKRLDMSLNYTIDEHPIRNFQPLSPDDVEVMLHTFLPHSFGSQQGLEHGKKDRRSVSRDNIQVGYARRPKVNSSHEFNLSPISRQSRSSSTAARHKRTAEPCLINILTSMYNYTEESEIEKEEMSTWDSFTSQVSILGLEKNPFRRNEQLQNLNLQLQKFVLDVINEQRQELDQNRKLQYELVKLLTERSEYEEKQKHLYWNQTRNQNHLQNKLESNENVTEVNNHLEDQLELFQHNITNEEQLNLTYPDKDEQLIQASKVGNLSAALFLTRLHANVSTLDQEYLTPLHWAAKASHLEVARVLLEAGANPEAKDISGNTPLHLAAELGNPEMIQLLVNSSNTMDLKNTDGETPLHVAIRSGNTENALELIKSGSNLNVRNNEDKNALQLAAKLGEEEVAKMLVDSGSEVDARSENGYSALHLAAQHGDVNVCKTLLDGGADVNALTLEKQTPLHLAVLSGHFPTVELLVQRGAKVKVRNLKGRTPSGIAARKGFKRIVTFLGQH